MLMSLPSPVLAAHSWVLWITCASVALSGCALGPSFKPNPTPEDKAIIYIYRPNKFFRSVAAPYVYVDGKKELWLGNGSYRPVVLPPGVHEIDVKEGADCAGSIRFSVVPARAYFLRFECLTPPESFAGVIVELAASPSFEGGEDAIEKEHVLSPFTPSLFFVKPDKADSEIKRTSLGAEMKPEGAPMPQPYSPGQ